MKKIIILLIAFFTTLTNATTYYVAANVSSTDVSAATNINTPCNLNAAWDDMCAGTTIGTGDTIQLGDGTYDDTTYDVPVAGLGNCSQNIDLTIQSESGDPELCIIDFSGNTSGVDGFHITSTGAWLFKGLTIHGSKSGGNITLIDGTLNVRNCIIYGGSGYGVKMTSTSAAAAVYLYNCEIYDTADDGVTSSGNGGEDSDHIIEAHYCYFHDITTAAFTQALTMHQGGIIRAYFCTFDNIGAGSPKTSGNAIGVGSDPNNHIYAYNCVVKNCYQGFSAMGTLEVEGCYFENMTSHAIAQGEPASTTVRNCIIYEPGEQVIRHNQASNLTISGNIIYGTGFSTYVILGKLSGDNDTTFTLTDNLIFSGVSADTYVARHCCRTWNIERNLIWCNHDAPSNSGIFFNGNTGNVTMNFEHNCIRKGGTDNLWYCAGTDTYTGGYNTITTGSGFASGISAKATDQTATITWLDFMEELMLPSNAAHYRDYGAAMMPGWWRPAGKANMGAFVRHSIKRIPSCADYNGDGIVNFRDYADFADDWLWTGPCGGVNKSDLNCDGVVDFKDLRIFALQWLKSCP